MVTLETNLQDEIRFLYYIANRLENHWNAMISMG